jgi:hypothetical protein
MWKGGATFIVSQGEHSLTETHVTRIETVDNCVSVVLVRMQRRTSA